MSSAEGSSRESLRTSCNDLVRHLVRLPLSIMDSISSAISRRASRRNPQNLQSQQHPEGLPVIPEELFFFNLIEQHYGDYHPFFYGCRFSEVLRIANREGKLIFVYLHDPEHPYTDPFCRRTLCSELVVEYLDANFLSWGAVVSRGEGSDLSTSLQAGSFPFCAVVAPASGESILVLQQIEGPVSPAELVEILQKTIDEQGSAFQTSRAEEEERRRSRQQLQQEQDVAYLEALRKDQEKDRAQRRLEERVTAASEQSKADEELRKKQFGRRTKEATKKTQIKGKVDPNKPEVITKIMIRFPNGERRQQNFHCTDSIRSIYNYIDSLDIPGIGNYRLISNYPRKVYGYEHLQMTLKDAGFHPSATLYLEPIQ